MSSYGVYLKKSGACLAIYLLLFASLVSLDFMKISVQRQLSVSYFAFLAPLDSQATAIALPILRLPLLVTFL